MTMISMLTGLRALHGAGMRIMELQYRDKADASIVVAVLEMAPSVVARQY